MAKEWIFILLHLLGVALYVTASPIDQTKKGYETLRAEQKLLDGLALAHGPTKDKNKEKGLMNKPQGPAAYIQKGKLNVTHELSDYNNSPIQNGTSHDRNKRSPSYTRNYNVKNTMYSPPAGKSYGKSYQPSSYGYGGPSGPYGGARSGRTAGRYAAEPMYGSPAGYVPVGGGGGGYSAAGYGGGYSAPPMPTYGGYQAAAGGYPGGYAPSPAGGGAAAAAQDPYGMIDEKALAKYIDELTKGSKSSRRRRHSGSNESHGSKHGKTRRQRKSKHGEGKATGSSRRRRKVTEKAAKKGNRRRRTEKTSRRTSRRRKSSSKSSSSSQEYYDDVSAASYDEEPYSKPKARRARDKDQVKPLDMSELYTPKPAYPEPIAYPSQKQSQSDLLLSSLFNSLFQSTVTKPAPKPQTPVPPATQPQQQNVASELAKLGQLIQTTFRKMTSRLDGMKMAREIRLRKETTPGPIDDNNFINSRSTSQWNNVKNRYQKT